MRISRLALGASFLALAIAGSGCSCADPVVPTTLDAGDSGARPDAPLDGRAPDAAGDASDSGGPICGDAMRTRPEVCDDGNTMDGDGCNATCESDETCANSYLDLDEVCDDGNTADGDGCRGDCLSDYLCGNGVTDTIASGGPAEEICDDGNTVNGDGCSAACDSDESCGNSVVDLAAGEVCDDGNTSGGDDCSADCAMSLLCGNGTIEGAEECDDSNTADGDGCSATCFVERCGNGRLDPTELCDDGNMDDTDGCRVDCTYTCSSDAACDDADVCNGAETCADPGTATSTCAPPASPASDGTACGTGLICLSGACATSGCGDGFTDPTASEACDDGNTADGDGCDADCTFTCSSDAACADADVCNGAETCSSPGTATSACAAGTALADGASCGAGLICNGGVCASAGCGDSIVSGTEQCDDGNTTGGDGCDADCTFTCSADVDCSDALACNGSETCSMPGTTGSRCNSGTPAPNGTACGAGRVCNMGVCATVGCGDGITSAPEQCDDGNMASGDGCDSDCTWTCASGADCTDGLVCNGTETCTSPSTLLSRCNAGAPLADGATCGGANICRTGTCVAAFCGDGIVTGTEQCDDGNAVNGDGCQTTCTWTCTGAGSCADGNACNGTESCTMPSTVMSRCAAGTPPPNGTSCGGANICVMTSCVAARCGDSIVTAPEVCDDGNTAADDGCGNTCQWTCTGAASCTDGNACNGTESCTMPSTIMSRCAPGAAPPTGMVCDRDGMPATRDICRTMMCLASVCGDGYVDAGATPVEMCDDSNTVSGDGCSSTCQTEVATPPTAFRLTNLDLISPRITVVPLFGCSDATQTPVFGFSVNGELDTAIGPMSSGGTYSLHIVDIFRPLSVASATSVMDVHFDAACMEVPTPDSCGPDATPDVVMTIANNQSAGSCFVPVAADVNTRAGTPAAYAPTVNTVGPQCFASDPRTIVVTLAGISIPLTNARLAATYSGTPTNRLVSGVVTGFLTETAAADIILPATLPVVGNTPLYTHLQAGNRSVMNSMGMTIADGCNVGGGAHEDDADTVGGVRGFWFFLNFTAELVTWTGP